MNIQVGAVTFNFTTLGIVKTNEGWVTSKVEILKERPTLATSDAPGSVYRYFNVWLGSSGYGTSSKIENAYIIFSVPDDWLKNNNAESIKLMKFIDGAWREMKTEKIGAETYKAETPGFSGYAIGVPKGLAVSPTPTPTPTYTFRHSNAYCSASGYMVCGIGRNSDYCDSSTSLLLGKEANKKIVA